MMTAAQEGKLLSQVDWLVKLHDGEGCYQVRLIKQGQAWLWIIGSIVTVGLSGWLGFLTARVFDV